MHEGTVWLDHKFNLTVHAKGYCSYQCVSCAKTNHKGKIISQFKFIFKLSCNQTEPTCGVIQALLLVVNLLRINFMALLAANEYAQGT